MGLGGFGVNNNLSSLVGCVKSHLLLSKIEKSQNDDPGDNLPDMDINPGAYSLREGLQQEEKKN